MKRKNYRDIITKEFCQKYFRYEEGRLFWIENLNKKCMIGKEVGYIKTKSNRKNAKPYRKVHLTIDGVRYNSVPLTSLIWILHGGSLGKKQILDHINHDTLDNRVENLRLATTRQNAANRPAQLNNTSGYKGVTYKADKNGYEAYINKAVKGERRKIYIGYFKCPEQAAKAYDKKAKEIFGEYAYLNFPEENSNVA